MNETNRHGRSMVTVMEIIKDILRPASTTVTVIFNVLSGLRGSQLGGPKSGRASRPSGFRQEFGGQRILRVSQHLVKLRPTAQY